MITCSEGHEEIVYEGDRWTPCPICALIKERDDKINELTDRVEELETDLRKYEEDN